MDQASERCERGRSRSRSVAAGRWGPCHADNVTVQTAHDHQGSSGRLHRLRLLHKRTRASAD